MENKITAGTKVEGNWGAMIPVSEGEVIYTTTQIINGKAKAVAAIEWDRYDDEGLEIESDVQIVDLSEIRAHGERSVNGSPVGIHLAV